MSNVINKAICLSLNRSWSPIGVLTVGEAVIAMSGGTHGHPAYGLDVDFELNEDGTLNLGKLANATPVPWERWILLPVRAHDLAITTARGSIRAPTIIVQQNYNKVPVKRPRLNSHSIYERDGGVDQYTGERVGRHEGNLDHVIPRDRGGRDTFENLVWTHRETNTRKANKLPHEVGLRLIRQPKAPAALPVSVTIREPKHPHWTPFLIV